MNADVLSSAMSSGKEVLGRATNMFGKLDFNDPHMRLRNAALLGISTLAITTAVSNKPLRFILTAAALYAVLCPQEAYSDFEVAQKKWSNFNSSKIKE